MNQNDYKEYIQYKVVIGSKAYGLNTPSSDEDVRGFYAAPAQSLIQLTSSPPEQLEFKVGSGTDKDVFWEIKKYLNLLLACNPTLIETLYTDIVLFTTPAADMLRDNRERFISARAYNTYRGYARQQVAKMSAGLTPDFKNGMHLIRLLKMCIHIFEYGYPNMTWSEADKVYLSSIRKGGYSVDTIIKHSKELEAQIEELYLASTLREEPDTEWANDFFQEIREDTFRKYFI